MFLTGFTDEAAQDIEGQIGAIKELGWEHLELRTVGGKNAHDISNHAFKEVKKKLVKAKVKVSCLGSNIANWGTSIESPFGATIEILKRTVLRAKALEIPFIRIMSYAVREDKNGGPLEEQWGDERFKRLKEICRILLDNGITPLHENCYNYGGMSWKHSLRLLEEVPGLKLAFDTGNPPVQADYSQSAPYPRQSSWEFYLKVKDYIEYVHIKDAIFKEETGEEIYTFPGEGDGDVKRIVKDLLDSGYHGGFSIEPHMTVVYHNQSIKASEEEKYHNFVKYGIYFMQLLDEASSKSQQHV